MLPDADFSPTRVRERLVTGPALHNALCPGRPSTQARYPLIPLLLAPVPRGPEEGASHGFQRWRLPAALACSHWPVLTRATSSQVSDFSFPALSFPGTLTALPTSPSARCWLGGGALGLHLRAPASASRLPPVPTWPPRPHLKGSTEGGASCAPGVLCPSWPRRASPGTPRAAV